METKITEIEEILATMPNKKRESKKVSSEQVNRKGINTSALLSETLTELCGIEPSLFFEKSAISAIKSKNAELGNLFEKQHNLAIAWNTAEPETARVYAQALNKVRVRMNEKFKLSLAKVNEN